MSRAQRKRAAPPKKKSHPKTDTGPDRPPAPPEVRHKTALLAVLLIVVAAVTCITHRRALTAQAQSMNDGLYVTQNYRVLNPSWAHAGRFLSEVTNPSTVPGYYQPLAMISLMLDSAMGGHADHLRPYHRTSLALHVANTALLIVLLYLLFRQPWAAAAAGLLFGVHPMTVEVIAWLGERKTTLATFFALGCLILYVVYTRRRTWLLYAACLATFVLALMSKPTVTPLPVLFLLLDYWPLRRLDRRAVVEKLPLFALAGVFAVITVVSQRHMDITQQQAVTFGQNVLLACHNVLFYPLKFVWPTNLSTVYPFPEPIGLSDRMVLGGVIVTILLIVAGLMSLRWTRGFVVGWLFFLVALAPTLMNVGYAMGVAADKYAYLPAVGFLLILAWLLSRLWTYPPARLSLKRVWPAIWATANDGVVSEPSEPARPRAGLSSSGSCIRIQENRAEDRPARPNSTSRYHDLLLANNDGRTRSKLCRPAIASVLLIVAAGYAVTTHRYLAKWQDTGVYCRHILTIAPDTSWVYNQLGSYLLGQGQIEQAVEQCRKAVELDPTSAKAHINLGQALAGQRAYDQAVASFNEALKIKADSAEAHHGLGVALAAQGHFDKAIDHFELALPAIPEPATAHFNLGLALAQNRQPHEAIAHFTTALELKSNYPEAHFRLADLLVQLGRSNDAIEHYRQALRFKPDEPAIHSNLGIELARQGKIPQAVVHLRKALELNPHDGTMYNNLGKALAQNGQLAEAIEHYHQAIRLLPDYLDAHHNLAIACARLDRIDEAIEQFRHVLRIRPGRPDTHCKLGDLLMRRGQIDDAIREYRAALAIDPDHAQARAALDAALASQAASTRPQ